MKINQMVLLVCIISMANLLPVNSQIKQKKNNKTKQYKTKPKHVWLPTKYFQVSKPFENSLFYKKTNVID